MIGAPWDKHVPTKRTSRLIAAFSIMETDMAKAKGKGGKGKGGKGKGC